MKVTTQDLSNLGAAGSSSAQATQNHGTSGGASNHHSLDANDQVQFSSTLGSLSRAMSTESASRQAKVQKLSTQYQAGTYQPRSAAISHGMVSEALGQ